MRQLLALLALSIALNFGGVQHVRGQTDKQDPAAETNPAAELVATHLKEALAWQDRYRAADKEDRPAILKERPSFQVYYEKFRKLADENRGTNIEESALAWMAINAPGQANKLNSLRRLSSDHSDSKLIADAVVHSATYHLPEMKLAKQFQQIAADSAEETAQAAAIYSLIMLFNRAEKLAGKFSSASKLSDPESAKRYSEEQKESITELATSDIDVESLLKKLAGEFNDVRLSLTGRKINIGEFAEAGLYEIRNLRVGCIAPDIEGSDLDGKQFKLSDYRGKIVMLDFWGDW